MILYQWAGDNARLLSIEEVGTKFGVDVNLKDEDKFHLTIEEYLLALVSLIDELVSPPPSLQDGAIPTHIS